MSKVRPQITTLLSGASHLIDDGHVTEAESIFFEVWSLAQDDGNESEKEIALSALTKFLRSRGRANEADQLTLTPILPKVISVEIQSVHVTLQHIIVVGSSAGGVEALSLLLNGLPKDLDAAVLVVQQTPGHSPSELAEMLNLRSELPVAIPSNAETILAGRIYLAPPNQHLMIKNGAILLGNGPKENRSRPAIDVLFRTAAHAYGPKVIGVILSGVLNDGTAGLMSIKSHGGKSVVQEPTEAVFDGMPRSAIALTQVDYILKATEIGPLLGTLIKNTDVVNEDAIAMPEYRDQADIGEVGGPGIKNVAPYPPSALTCPSCGGAVWQIQEQSLILFKCHTGHSYTAELMLEEQSEMVDAAAWILLRSMNENIHLRRQLCEWSRSAGHLKEAEFHEQQAIEAEKQSLSFRNLLLSNEKGRD
jgi:two-component system chemotaxis response regulator CheB